MIERSRISLISDPGRSVELQVVEAGNERLRHMAAELGVPERHLNLSKRLPSPTHPQGEIVWHLRSGDDVYQVEKLVTPVLRGAGLRTHRLWRNSGPAVGHQWCYSLEDAQWWAEWLIERDLKMQISLLKTRVLDLESRLSRERFTPQPY